MSDKFRVGAKVVYPAYGLGVVEKYRKMNPAELLSTHYVIRIIESGLTIKVPPATAAKIGVRDVMPRREIAKVLKVLSNGLEGEKFESNWNRRQKAYLEKIKSGSLYQIASVYRDLYLLKSKKGLSFGERRVMDNVRNLMISEIAESKGIAEDKALKLVEKAIN